MSSPFASSRAPLFPSSLACLPISSQVLSCLVSLAKLLFWWGPRRHAVLQNIIHSWLQLGHQLLFKPQCLNFLQSRFVSAALPCCASSTVAQDTEVAHVATIVWANERRTISYDFVIPLLGSIALSGMHLCLLKIGFIIFLIRGCVSLNKVRVSCRSLKHPS